MHGQYCERTLLLPLLLEDAENTLKTEGFVPRMFQAFRSRFTRCGVIDVYLQTRLANQVRLIDLVGRRSYVLPDLLLGVALGNLELSGDLQSQVLESPGIRSTSVHNNATCL